MIILSEKKYKDIRDFIYSYKGLAIDCELQLVQEFPDVPKLTLKSILQLEKQLRLKQVHARINAKSSSLFAEYNKRLKNEESCGQTLLKMAMELDVSPTSFCRMILNAAYKDCAKSEITEMIRNFDLIPDPLLSLNVSHCAFNDNQEGSLADAANRCIGEEYELRLKEMARNAGMVFYDEGDLRREGYDKTPDLKLAIPFLLKGKPVHWIESKALFGGPESHKRYLKDQLLSYLNRFGPGIVIYWFGYLQDIKYFKENDENITILNSFPDKSDMEFFRFNEEIGEQKTEIK